MRYLIIGNSAAGVFAAEAVRELDREGSVDIISDEKYPAYARCLTSSYLSGAMKDSDIWIRPDDFYERNKLNLRSGEKVVKIDFSGSQVYTDAERAYCYDKLLIATGASPTMPKIPGIDAKGVFGLRTLSDAKNILQYSGSGKRAVVVGGGFVSIKAAYALLKAGLHVTCLITSGQILSQMLDRDAAEIVAGVLSSKGLVIRYNTDVSEIISNNDNEKGPTVRSVRLSGREEIPADLVIIGKGVSPNTGFLAGSGIKIEHGVVVDRYLQTNQPNLFAAGDVAQTHDVVFGDSRINAIWPNAAEQGRVAGRNMAGMVTEYPGSLGMNAADFFGLSTIAAGHTRAEGDDYEVVKLYPGPGLYRKLVFKGDILVGYVLVGQTARAGLLTTLIKEKRPLGKSKNELKTGLIRQGALW